VAKVLRTKGGVREIQYYVAEGGGYQFGDSGETAGMCLVLKEKHVSELLAAHGDDLEIVQESKWPEIYKKKAQSFEEDLLGKATAAFPEVVEKLTGKKKK